jgi:hypothetical protein
MQRGLAHVLIELAVPAAHLREVGCGLSSLGIYMRMVHTTDRVRCRKYIVAGSFSL